MKAMIMAAGVGSRLMPLTEDISKPMVPMANRPLMENIIDLLQQHGFDQIIANLHYHAESISQHFGDGQRFGVDLHYSREEELMGTAGGVRKCAWFLDDTFIIVSGDALTDADLGRLVEEHRKKGAVATIALKEVDEVENFGIVITDADGRITSFQEKPRASEALSHYANTGIYIFEPEIFDYIPAGQFYDFGKQVFPELVRKKAPFYGVDIQSYWCDVGSIDSYRQSHADILRGLVAVPYQGKKTVSPKGQVLLLGEGCKISDGVEFKGNVVVGPQVQIQSGAVICDTVVWANTVVKSGSILEKCVIGADCCLENSVVVNPGAVIGSRCLLESHSIIPPNSRISALENDQILRKKA
jgi:NDP-sugar pyrophosphorylase family protein